MTMGSKEDDDHGVHKQERNADHKQRNRTYKRRLKQLRELVALLPLVTAIGGAVVVLVGSAWTIFKYTETRRIEAQRPFLSEQLKVYLKTANTLGNLQNLTPLGTDWKKAANQFWALRWSVVALVGDPGIRQAMRRVEFAILATEAEAEAEKAKAKAEKAQAKVDKAEATVKADSDDDAKAAAAKAEAKAKKAEAKAEAKAKKAEKDEAKILKETDEKQNMKGRLHYLRRSIECLADEMRTSLETSWGSSNVARWTITGLDRRGLPNGCTDSKEPPPRLPAREVKDGALEEP
jgi:chemotaxis protein histidine kinase CheA